MKSREYRDNVSGRTYWLEDGGVMVRLPNGKVAVSGYSVATFFVMVGNDTLKLVEGQE